MKLEIQKLHTLQGHKDAIYALHHQDKSDKFYSSGGDGLIVEWDFNSFPDGQLIAQVPNSVYSIVSENDSIYVGHNYEGIHFLNSATKKEKLNTHLGQEAIFSSLIIGDHLLIGLANGEFVVLNKHTLKTIARETLGKNRIRKIIQHQQFVYLACSDNFIYQLDLNYKLVSKWLAHDKSVTSLVVHNNILISVGRDAKIKFWELLEHNKLCKEIPAHNYAINDISISPDKKYFATCSIDKTIKLWSTQNRKLLKVVDKQRHAGHGTSVNKVFWKSNDCFVSCSDDRTISVWKIKERQ